MRALYGGIRYCPSPLGNVTVTTLEAFLMRAWYGGIRYCPSPLGDVTRSTLGTFIIPTVGDDAHIVPFCLVHLYYFTS